MEKTEKKGIVKRISDYFKPQEKVRVVDVLREVPGATVKTLQEILQGTARSFDFVGRKALDPVAQKLENATGINYTETTRPTKENTLTQILYGGNDRRKNTLAEFGGEEFGVDAKKNPTLANILGIGAIASEFIPGGKGAKTAGKSAKGLVKQFPKKIFSNELIDDVRSYSTSKDFFENLPTLFHGTNAGDTIKKEGFKVMPPVHGAQIMGRGVYLTPTKSEAQNFGKEVFELKLNPDVKILDTDPGTMFQFMIEANGKYPDVEVAEAITKLAQDKGYGGIRTISAGNQGETYVSIFNPDDIWDEKRVKEIWKSIHN